MAVAPHDSTESHGLARRVATDAIGHIDIRDPRDLGGRAIHPISHHLGARVLALYLGTVVVMSLLFGLAFEQLLAVSATDASAHAHGTGWIALLSTFVLLALLALLSFRRLRARMASPMPPTDGTVLMQIDGMSCQHCVGSVKRSLEALDAVVEAQPELSSGLVSVRGGRLDATALIRAVEQAGFSVTSVDGASARVDAHRSMD